jgi:hypothetical protein
MKTDKIYKELYGKDGEKISELVRKHHFYTAWKNVDKEDVLFIAKKVIVDFNQWKSEECGIIDGWKWKKHSWMKNGGYWEQLEGNNELIRPDHIRLEKDFHLMYCFSKNYKKARNEFIRLILGDY